MRPTVIVMLVLLGSGCALAPRVSPQAIAVVRDVAIEVAARLVQEAVQPPVPPPVSAQTYEIRTVRLDPPHVPPRPFF